MTAFAESRPKRFAQIAAATWLLLTILAPTIVVAQNTPTTGSRIVQSQNQLTIDADLDEHLAHEWNLQAEEWARYRQLMQGPLGVYSPNLDPLTALGIEARSEEERRRYAELQVQAEAQRVGKTLAYRSEERRVGKEGVSTCRSRWSRVHSKKTNKQ